MINFKQLFCRHDWIPFRTYIYKEYGKDDKDPSCHNVMLLDDNPDTTYRVLKKGNCSYSGPDDFCPKCEKFNLKLTRWLVKKDNEYLKLKDSLIKRGEYEAMAKDRAKALLEILG